MVHWKALWPLPYNAFVILLLNIVPQDLQLAHKASAITGEAQSQVKRNHR